MKNSEDLRNHVYDMLEHEEKFYVIKHFKEENILTLTIYVIIKRFENGIPFNEEPKPGGPSRLSTREQKNIIRNAEHKIGASQ
ncbi:hypothetical protein ILUMI_08545 [Ignelater luminosus]|uniref:Uncharacterized protein n=1 Tax=Ignelater luminosus TaxID=2038154 RepID=A0A8K0D6P5_IGNLU|nr:hypothetical protein ILUMI_08545 [Ignelater luminosus]